MTNPTLLVVAVLIAYQLLKIRKVIIRARVSLVEKISFALSIVLILVVAYISAETTEHYLVALSLAILVFVSMMKIGMTETDIQSMGRLFLGQTLKSVQSAVFIRKSNGREFELQTAGKTRTVVLTYDNARFEPAMAHLLEHLDRKDIQVVTEEEYYQKRNRKNMQ